MESFIVCAFEANFQNIMKGWAICADSSLHRSREIVLRHIIPFRAAGTGKLYCFR